MRTRSARAVRLASSSLAFVVGTTFALEAWAQALKAETAQEAKAAQPARGAKKTKKPQKPELAPTPEETWAERDRKLNEGATLSGSTGLLHTQHAQGQAAGQFRLAFTTEYFSSGFLCTDAFPCRDPRTGSASLRSDSNDHTGGHLSLSAQIFDWLELSLATSAIANSNAANRPALLQVLGDSSLGAHAYLALDKVFAVGGGAELLLVNGTGAVGLDGGGTSGMLRGLGTADLRGLETPLPFRFSGNVAYAIDNSGNVVQATEASRGTSITRIERFGLGINRVDRLALSLGAEALLFGENVRPFVELGLALPVNRQGYKCRADNPSGDRCLANESALPSRATLGGRFFPWKRGFNALLAFDIGLSGTRTFIEELKPEAPWMFYLGAGWAFDTQERPAPSAAPPVAVAPTAQPANKRPRVRGFVHEEGKAEGLAGAIVAWENHPEFNSLVSFADGRFVTQALDDGSYVFKVNANGFKSGSCTARIEATPKPPSSRAPLKATSSIPAVGSAAAERDDITIDCALVALPRQGTILGRVHDVDTDAPVPNVTIKLSDAQKRELSTLADTAGTFRFADTPLGSARLSVDAEGYLPFTLQIDVALRADNEADLGLKKRPKESSVTLGKSEIFIKQQVQFAVDSATLLPASNGLLLEIADVLEKNPRLKRVEVQGHTDNTGSPEHNQQLSTDRARAVVTWLTAHGIAAERLSASGYGQTQPLAPNVTVNNRAKNRRVQFILLDQEPTAAPKAKR